MGPSDFALALELEPAPELEHPALLDAIDRVRDACGRHDLIAGLHCLTGPDAARFADQGFRMITVGVDVLFLRAAMTDELRRARTHIESPLSFVPAGERSA